MGSEHISQRSPTGCGCSPGGANARQHVVGAAGHARPLRRRTRPRSTARRRVPAAVSARDALAASPFPSTQAPACTTSKWAWHRGHRSTASPRPIERCSAAPASDSPQLRTGRGRRTARHRPGRPARWCPPTRNPPTSPGARSARSGTGCQRAAPCPLACTRLSSDSAGITAGTRLPVLRQPLRSTRSPGPPPAPHPRPPVPG